MLKINDISTSAEFSALLQLLQKQQCSEESINPEHLLQLIADHRIYGPLLRSNIQSIDGFEEIASQCLNNKLSQLTLGSALGEISELLEGINWMGLKGPVLSQYLYDDPAERTSKDLDIFISENDLDQVLQLFSDSGYTILTYWNSPKQKKAIIHHYHHVELVHPKGNIVVELHWKLFKYSQHNISLTDELTNSQLTKIGAIEYPIFQKETLLYYLVIHGLQHGFFRLQWLYDIYQLVIIDKEIFSKTMLKYGENKYSQRALIATAKLINLYLNEKVEYTVNYDFDRKSTKLVNYCIKAISSNDTYLVKKDQSRLGRAISIHHLNYLMGGIPLLFKGLIARNVRPLNWKYFAFPDSVFFLNHLFSRVISLLNKLKK